MNREDKKKLCFPEGELEPAEKKVLNAFRKGWKGGDWEGGIVVPEKGSKVPSRLMKEQKEGDWKGAILRAEFLRDLFLENYGSFNPRQIKIIRAWIKGRLNLGHCESKFPLVFETCIFGEGISLLNATIPRLSLKGCTVGKFKDKDSNMQSYALLAQEAKVATGVFLNAKFTAEGQVSLDGAKIGGQLRCSGYFKDGIYASSLNITSDVILGLTEKETKEENDKPEEGLISFKSKGEVRLHNAVIGGQLRCSGNFSKGFDASNLKTGSDVILGLFKETQNKQDEREVLFAFNSDGKVSLRGAEIGGVLNCSNGCFKEEFDARNMKTRDDVGLDCGFNAMNKVDLRGAEIGGVLYCYKGIFHMGFDATNLKTGSDVILGSPKKQKEQKEQLDAFTSCGKVSLCRAIIRGQLRCSDGKFTNADTMEELALDASDMKVGDVLLNKRFKAKGTVKLSGAEIMGDLDCRCGWPEKVPLVLNDTKVDGGFYLSLEKYNREAGPSPVSGFIYGAIEIKNESDPNGGRDCKNILEWMELQIPKEQFYPQPYEQLMAVYRRIGHTSWARKVGFSLEEKRHNEFKKKMGAKGPREFKLLLWYCWYYILKWTIGYGYQPFRSFFLFSIFLALGTIVFWPNLCGNEWIPTDGDILTSHDWTQHRRAPSNYLPFCPFFYSLEALFPVLNLGLLEKWHPADGWVLLIRWILTFLGTVLLAILALFGVGVLGPCWKDRSSRD